MPRNRLERIRDCFRTLRYDMTAHPMEEMAEDSLDTLDLEHAVLTGDVVRVGKHDPRGTKYVISGLAADGETRVGVVGRFVETGRFLVITLYEIS